MLACAQENTPSHCFSSFRPSHSWLIQENWLIVSLERLVFLAHSDVNQFGKVISAIPRSVCEISFLT